MRSQQQAQQMTIDNLKVRVQTLEAIKTENRENESPQSSESPRVNVVAETDSNPTAGPNPTMFKQHLALPSNSRSPIHAINQHSPQQTVSPTNVPLIRTNNMSFMSPPSCNPQIGQNMTSDSLFSDSQTARDTVSTSSTSPQSHHMHPQQGTQRQQLLSQRFSPQLAQNKRYPLQSQVQGTPTNQYQHQHTQHLQQRGQAQPFNLGNSNVNVISLPSVAQKNINATGLNGSLNGTLNGSLNGALNGAFSVNGMSPMNALNPPSTLTNGVTHQNVQFQQQQLQQQQHQNMNVQSAMSGNSNNDLPTTSLYSAGLYDSNDSLHDLKMFGNANQSFNSSDAGMANMATPIPVMPPTIPVWYCYIIYLDGRHQRP